MTLHRVQNLFFFTFVYFSLFQSVAFGQLDSTKIRQKMLISSEKRHYSAVKTDNPPKIDGKLDDAAWQTAPLTNNFTQEAPKLGEIARFQTDVRILYDDEAIYLSAFMHDLSRDSVLRELCVRDGDSNSDWFFFALDTYRSGVNAFGFSITPPNVQGDFLLANGNDDKSWNAVWFSATDIRDDGWTAEFKIPYSALRFAEAPEQIWNIQIGRERRQSRETAWWSPFDPNKNGFMSQAGILENIKGIKPPVRLAFMPFVSGAVTHHSGIGEQTSFAPVGRAGLDIKYGINDAFTLDMTLVPDFGQVRSDDRILNLGAFEVRYDEQRAFFTEGLELFSKGDLFYSRRIGGTPRGYYDVADQLKTGEKIVFNPTEGQILNSSKLSGRTKSGLGIGVLNSVTNQLNAIVQNQKGEERLIETDPLTNYNIFVLDQNLNYNSSISFINTNVWRAGAAQESNVSAAAFSLNNKANTYGVFGTVQLSQQYKTGFQNIDFGQKYDVTFGKTSGKWQYYLNYWQFDDHFDSNDLGYLPYNNERGLSLQGSFREFKPKQKWLQNYQVSTNAVYNKLVNPDRFTNLYWGANFNLTTKKFLSVGLFASVMPIATYDYFEPRVWGKYFETPDNYNLGAWLSSDYRKAFALDLSSNFRYYNDNIDRRYRLNFSISPRYRVNNQLSFNADVSSYNFINDVGFATFLNDEPTFGRRNVHTLVNTVNTIYTFNNRMGLSLRFRHYWSTATYSYYNSLLDNGKLGMPFTEENNKPVNADRSFNAFTVDAVYSWVFAPGSQASIVWKQGIYQSDQETRIDYLTDFNKTLASPQTNTLSVKVLYYIDYLNIKTMVEKRKKL